MTIAFFRLALGFLVVVAWMGVKGSVRDAAPRGAAWLLVLLGMTVGAGYTLVFVAYKRLGVDVTVFIVFLGPILWVLASPLVLRERLRPVVLIALGIAFAGIASITAPGFSSRDTLGFLAAAGSSVLFAATILAQKLLVTRYSPEAIVAWQLGLAALALSPVLVATPLDVVIDEAILLLTLGLLCTGAANVIFVYAARRLEAQQLGVLQYLEPASAVLFAWLFIGERPSATTIVGGALILIAGAIVVRFDRAPVVGASSPDQGGVSLLDAHRPSLGEHQVGKAKGPPLGDPFSSRGRGLNP